MIKEKSKFKRNYSKKIFISQIHTIYKETIVFLYFFLKNVIISLNFKNIKNEKKRQNLLEKFIWITTII
jgi:hypothetical protein